MRAVSSLGPRRFDRAAFERAYDSTVVGNHFFEEPGYYRVYRERYGRTLDYLCRLPLQRGARVLEVGGGQMALLLTQLFGDACTLADVNPTHSAAVEKFGLGFVTCDLLHDDLDAHDEYDLLVLCEVIEHVPIPPHQVLAKLARCLRPGGYLFLTTPNLYRLRNVLRLAAGMEVFCHFEHPERGEPIGHFLEYSPSEIRWQLERAGLDVLYVDLAQLTNRGSERLRAHGPPARRTAPLGAPAVARQPGRLRAAATRFSLAPAGSGRSGSRPCSRDRRRTPPSAPEECQVGGAVALRNRRHVGHGGGRHTETEPDEPGTDDGVVSPREQGEHDQGAKATIAASCAASTKRREQVGRQGASTAASP